MRSIVEARSKADKKRSSHAAQQHSTAQNRGQGNHSKEGRKEGGLTGQQAPQDAALRQGLPRRRLPRPPEVLLQVGHLRGATQLNIIASSSST